MPHAKGRRAVFPSDCDALTHYIFHNYFSLLSLPEKLAWKSLAGEFKAAAATSPEEARAIRSELVSEDPSVKLLLAEGPATFYVSVRDRVLSEHGDKVCLNHCPKCGVLARTPTACLCPSCNHTWYELRSNRNA